MHTLYLKKILKEVPMTPEEAFCLDGVTALALQVKSGDNSSEELVEYLNDLIHDRSVAMLLTNRLISFTEYLSHDPDNVFSDMVMAARANSVLHGTQFKVTPELWKLYNYNTTVELAEGNPIDGIVWGLKELHENDSYPNVRRTNNPYYDDTTRPLLSQLEQAFCGTLITGKGIFNTTAFNEIRDRLYNEHHIKISHRVLEEDSFGPLICGVSLPKGIVTYG